MIPPPESRFTGRAGVYARSRPAYPPGVIELLQAKCGLGLGCTVADMGAGTGIFARQLAATGASVIAVEPNDDMRSQISVEPGLLPWKGSAEHSNLPSRSIHLFTAAQAFHWFDPVAARAEWERLAIPPGWVALVWNTRVVEPGTLHGRLQALMLEYARRRLGRGTEPDQPRSHAELGLSMDLERIVFANLYRVDREAFVGNACSVSYVPKEGETLFPMFVQEVGALFDAEAGAETVDLPYTTELFLGRLVPS